MENIHSDVGFSRVINQWLIPYLWLSSNWFISSSNSIFSALTLAHCWFWLCNDSLPLARLYNQTETRLILNIITEDCIWETCTHVRAFVSYRWKPRISHSRLQRNVCQIKFVQKLNCLTIQNVKVQSSYKTQMPLTLFHDVVPPQRLVPEVPWQFYNLQGKKSYHQETFSSFNFKFNGWNTLWKEKTV